MRKTCGGFWLLCNRMDGWSFVTYYHCHERGGGQDGHMDLFGWVEIKDQWTVASHLWFP